MNNNLASIDLGDFLITPIEPFSYLGSNYFIKREDLSGGLFNGIKQRKIQGLLTFIKQKRPKKIALKGSLYSNFLLAIVPELIKEKIPFDLYTKRLSGIKPIGNFYFLSFFINSSQIHPLSDLPLDDPDCLIIEEGGDQPAGYLGLLSLGDEILNQLKENNLEIENIWIDAGTGSTAACLAYSLSKYSSNIKLHIVSMKEEKPAFNAKADAIFSILNAHLNLNLKNEKTYQFYRPKSAKAFGSTNTKIFQEIQKTAQESGVLFDPIYSIKMLVEMKEHLTKAPTLLIHSGGTLSLSGFQTTAL